MEDWLFLASPVWWAALVIATAGLSLGSSLAFRWTRQKREAVQPQELLRSLRLRVLVLSLLCFANLSMLGVLVMGGLRTPSWTGPLGLALFVLGMSSPTLAWSSHRAANRALLCDGPATDQDVRDRGVAWRDHHAE